MSKRRIMVCVTVLNVVMVVAFVLSNIYVWDYLNTEINLNSSHQSNTNTIVPQIQIDGFQITVSHAGWANDGTMIPMAAPISILNFPFSIFWITIIGNLILIALILRKQT